MPEYIFIPLLTLIGFALIVIDLLFIPGGLLIAAGSAGIMWSIYRTYVYVAGDHGGLFGIAAATVHTLICLAAVPKLITWSLDRVALKDEMSARDGFVGLTSRADVVGLRGTAVCDLRPSGTIILENEGRRLDCVADGGYIEKGQLVEIVEERGPSLVVRKV